MGNAKGVVTFKSGREVFKLKFSNNAMVLFEDTHGVEFTHVHEYFMQFSEGTISFKALRALLFAGLSDHHAVTLEAAGELIDAVGFALVMEKLAKAIEMAFPPVKAPAADEVGNVRTKDAGGE